MIYPRNQDAIKTLIDSRNGDYNERKFYDCQDQAILLKACYSQQNIIRNNWKLLNKILMYAIVQLCMDWWLIASENVKIWSMNIIKLFDASSLVGIPHVESYFMA